ncbi:MAG: DUF4328 domain-containing protein [Bacteroidota bacterium]
MKDNSQRGRIAQILLLVMLGLEVAMMISGLLQSSLLTKLENGDYVSDQAINLNDLREGVIGIAYFIAYVISAVVYIQWFRRAYYNLHQKVNVLTYTEGWAAGGWFVPFLNLVRPYQIMRELYVESKILLSRGQEERKSANLIFINVWWGLWLVSNVYNNIVTRVVLDAESMDELILSTNLGIIGNIIGIPLAILAWKVVHDYALLEPELALLDNDGEDDQTIPSFKGRDDILDVPI